MELDFLNRLAFYFIKAPTPSILPEIALQGLEEGFESPSLIMLAGLSSNENPFKMEEYLKKAMQELNLNFLDKELLAFSLIRATAKKILNDEVEPYEGCQFIFEQVLDSIDLRKRDIKYVYEGIGLAEIYGLYIQIYELKYDSVLLNDLRSKEEHIEEAKEMIKSKFSEWYSNNSM